MSVGVVGAAPDAEPAAVLAAADAAMYRAKHEGGNQVISGCPPDRAAPADRAGRVPMQRPARPPSSIRASDDQGADARPTAGGRRRGQASRVMFTVTSSAAAVPPE